MHVPSNVSRTKVVMLVPFFSTSATASWFTTTIEQNVANESTSHGVSTPLRIMSGASRSQIA
jgi:hypothetical protein